VLQIALIALFAIVMTSVIIVSLAVFVAPMMYYIECTLGIFILISVILMASTTRGKTQYRGKSHISSNDI